jgi:uncharacterized membrane protein
MLHFIHMDRKRYNWLRAAVALFVAAIVSMSVTRESYLMATIGVIIGMLFMIIVRSKAKITIDEREKTIREKAAQITYAIFAPTIGIGAFLLLVPSYSGLSIFAKGEFAYLESLGMILAYLTLFLIALYTITYHFLNRKYGGGNEE